jgi:hypothetical protein
VDAPALEPDGDGWSIELPEKASRRLTTADLSEALRKPHPWD